MKTAGIILILFSGTGLGFCKSMELDTRLKILETLVQLLLLLKGEIRCTRAALEDAFLDVAAKMPGGYRLFMEETAMLSFPGRKTGISGPGNAGGTADASGRRTEPPYKDSEKRSAKAAENLSEHGNPGGNSAGDPVMVGERRPPWKSVLFSKLRL